jgi:hypothetical protein
LFEFCHGQVAEFFSLKKLTMQMLCIWGLAADKAEGLKTYYCIMKKPAHAVFIAENGTFQSHLRPKLE